MGFPKSLIFLVFLLLPFSIFLLNTEEEIFVLNPQNVCYEVWGGFNGDAVGDSRFEDGKFKMWINDTSGSWGLAKLSRGLMPHYWGLRYAPLKREIEIQRFGVPLSFDVILKISLRLNAYQNYTVSNSSTNVAIVFFFDGYKTDYQEKCYQTEIQFFSYYGEGIIKGKEYYFTWRNDSVAQFKLEDNLKVGEFKEYEINLLPYINKMMIYYKLDKVKLKHIEIFTEAFKGYCSFEVYSCQIVLRKNFTSPNFLTVFIIFYLFSFVLYRYVFKRL